MRMPRFRFTVRRMMITVAVFGVLLGSAVRLHRLARRYRGVATRFQIERIEAIDAAQEVLSRWRAEGIARGENLQDERPAGERLLADLIRRGLKPSDKAYQAVAQVFLEEEAARGPRYEAARRTRTRAWREEMAAAVERTKRLAALASKYERAARYPWLPVAPDPPEPK